MESNSVFSFNDYFKLIGKIQDALTNNDLDLIVLLDKEFDFFIKKIPNHIKSDDRMNIEKIISKQNKIIPEMQAIQIVLSEKINELQSGIQALKAYTNNN